eukprot:12412172-Karenia_brevis.AAC.1
MTPTIKEEASKCSLGAQDEAADSFKELKQHPSVEPGGQLPRACLQGGGNDSPDKACEFKRLAAL